MKKQISIALMLCFGLAVFAQNETAKPEMLLLRAGSYQLGTDDNFREAPTHMVKVDTVYLSKYEITNAQYATFVAEYGSITVKDGEAAGEKMFEAHAWGLQETGGAWKPAAGYESYPMIKVTWYGAAEYCKWAGGRLPTEAEWTYAARGGRKTKGYTYSGSNTASEVAWFSDNSKGLNHPVGQLKENELGFYDMSGNVYEWCSDYYGFFNDMADNSQNPTGIADGVSRVMKGGCRGNGTGDLRLQARESLHPSECLNFLGFRLASASQYLGTEESLAQKQTGIYPNPASGHFNVNNGEEVVSLLISSAGGAIVLQQAGPVNQVNISSLSSGTYFVRILFADKVSTHKLIVK